MHGNVLKAILKKKKKSMKITGKQTFLRMNGSKVISTYTHTHAFQIVQWVYISNKPTQYLWSFHPMKIVSLSPIQIIYHCIHKKGNRIKILNTRYAERWSSFSLTISVLKFYIMAYSKSFYWVKATQREE